MSLFPHDQRKFYRQTRNRSSPARRAAQRARGLQPLCAPVEDGDVAGGAVPAGAAGGDGLQELRSGERHRGKPGSGCGEWGYV